MAIRKEMHNKRPRLNLLPLVYVEFCSLLPPVYEICKLTWIWLKMSTYSYTLRYYTEIKKRRELINIWMQPAKMNLSVVRVSVFLNN